MKQSQTFKFDPKLIKKLKALAKLKNRSFNNYVETELQMAVENNIDVLKKVAKTMNEL